MAKIVQLFILFFCILMSIGIALGNNESQYEYETHVELTSEENENHTGTLWTYLTDFESYRSVYRFLGQNVLLQPGSVITTTFNYTHKIDKIDFDRTSFLWKLSKAEKDEQKKFIYLKSLTFVPNYIEDLAMRQNQTVTLRPRCSCMPIHHLGRVEVKKRKLIDC